MTAQELIDRVAKREGRGVWVTPRCRVHRTKRPKGMSPEKPNRYWIREYTPNRYASRWTNLTQHPVTAEVAAGIIGQLLIDEAMEQL